MAVCPFMSNFVYDGSDVVEKEKDCITTSCQVWDSENGQCGAKVSSTIKSSSTENDNLITYLESVVGKESERDESNSLTVYFHEIFGVEQDKVDAAEGNNILTLWNHYHDSHNHAIQHTVSSVPAGGGGPTSGGGTSAPAAVMLVNEYMGNEDMDSNGKIYGYDFKIADSDDKPPMLKGIEQQADWIEPPETMTWSDYMASL